MTSSLQPPPPRQAPFLEGTPMQAVTQPWSGWFRKLYSVLQPGLTVTVVISGTTLTFKNGILTGKSP